MKVSASVVTYNSEKEIRGVLDSLKNAYTNVYILREKRTVLSASNACESTLQETLASIAIISLIFLPTIIVHLEFYRLYRNCYCVIYALLLTKHHDKNDKYHVLFTLYIVMLSLFLFYKEFSSMGYYYEAVTEPIFNENLLFDFLFE